MSSLVEPQARALFEALTSARAHHFILEGAKPSAKAGGEGHGEGEAEAEGEGAAQPDHARGSSATPAPIHRSATVQKLAQLLEEKRSRRAAVNNERALRREQSMRRRQEHIDFVNLDNSPPHTPAPMRRQHSNLGPVARPPRPLETARRGGSFKLETPKLPAHTSRAPSFGARGRPPVAPQGRLQEGRAGLRTPGTGQQSPQRQQSPPQQSRKHMAHHRSPTPSPPPCTPPPPPPPPPPPAATPANPRPGLNFDDSPCSSCLSSPASSPLITLARPPPPPPPPQAPKPGDYQPGAFEWRDPHRDSCQPATLVVEQADAGEAGGPDSPSSGRSDEGVGAGVVLRDGWVVERTWKKDGPRPDPERHRKRQKVRSNGTCVLADGWVVERTVLQGLPRPDPDRHRRRQQAMASGTSPLATPFADLLGEGAALNAQDQDARESFETAPEFDPLLFVLDFPVSSFSPLAELRLFLAALRWEFAGTNVGFASAGGSFNWVDAFSARSNRVFRSFGAFVLVRLLLLGMCTFLMAVSLVNFAKHAPLQYWAIYLTNWTLTVEWLYFLFAFLAACQSIGWDSGDAVDPLPWVVRAAWFAQAIALPGSLLVTLMYWAIVNDRPMAHTRFTQVSSHGLNFLLILLDSLMFAQPYLLLHGLYLALFGTVYMLFNLSYQLLGFRNEDGEESIYGPINWASPLSTTVLSFVLLLVAVPLVNVVVWWTFFLRNNFRLRLHAAESLSRVPRSPQFQLQLFAHANQRGAGVVVKKRPLEDLAEGEL